MSVVVVRARRAAPSVAALLLAGCLLLPLVPLALWAGASRWSWPAALPQEWGARGWRQAGEAGVLSALVRSTALGALVAGLATPLGAWAGRALGWRLARRTALPSVVLLAPVALPPFALAMGLDVVLLRLGVPETVAVVVLLTVFALPYTSYTLRAAYAGVDPELEDQARMLGASARQARRRVTLRALRPAVAAAAALAFLVGWSDYVVTLVVGGGQIVTAPVLLAATASGTGSEAAVAALAVASVLPPLGALALVAAVVTLRRRATGPGSPR